MKNDIIPKKNHSHKNVSIGFGLVLPRNNVFSQKYIYDKCISLKILLCLAVLWQSHSVLKSSKKYHLNFGAKNRAFLNIWIFALKMAKITPVGSNVGFWRENSNISYLKVNVARFARDVGKLRFLGCFSNAVQQQQHVCP